MRDDRSDLVDGEIECGGEMRKRKGVVVSSVGEKGCLKIFFLDFFGKNVFNFGSVV